MLKDLFSKQLNFLSFALIFTVFYLMAYYTVSDFLPSSTPVHHDDYTNYSSVGSGLVWSWIRPLSAWLIFVLSSLGPDWLIWTVRILSATYIFLCWKIVVELVQPRQYWISLAMFAMASLSSPIVAEYARYTGMVTHLMSGSLGLAAVFFLFKDDREENDNWLYVSLILLFLSALAKEDFILFYVFSFVYVLFKSKNAIQRRILIGFIGSSVSLMAVVGAKVLAGSTFLGVSDEQSTYFINTAPASVVTTVWRYLTGAGHPAMTLHGQIIATTMIFSGIMALIVILRDRVMPKTLYVIGAALTLIAPYSVLPNHVNAYYELIWLPFIIGSVYVALAEALNISTATPMRAYLASAIFSALCVSLAIVDTPGRCSIARWYDSVGSDNAKVLMHLERRKAAINAAPSVCVYGANAFSPWYIHSGKYLETVMGLHTVWNIVIDKSSSLYPGFRQGAASSKGRVVVSGTSDANASCLKISIENTK